MTLADFQPYVERVVTAYEWATARTRWRQGLLDEREAITKAIANLSQMEIDDPERWPFDREPYDARLRQIAYDLEGDVTADCVPVLPLRSVPMDMITAAVIRRILRVPAECPVLSIKVLPSPEQIDDAVTAIAERWRTPHGETLATT